MEIGISAPNGHRPGGREAIRAITTAADRLGFDSVWLLDHLCLPPNNLPLNEDMFTGDLYEAFTTAGYIAAITERVKIGFGVIVLPYRNPVVTAKIVATLDHLSNGRVIFGIGAGGWVPEFNALGITMKDRGARTDEYIRAFRAIWSSELPVFHGKFVNVEGVQFKPRPVQDPLPIWVGGGSDAAYKRAVTLGDGFCPLGTSEGLRQSIDKLRRYADQYNRDFSTLGIYAQPPVRFAPTVEAMPDAYYKPGVGGNPPLIGPPEYLAEELEKFAAVGVTHLVADVHISMWHYDDQLQPALEAMQRFAEEVRPLIPSAASG